MNDAEIIDLAKNLSTHIIMELRLNYEKSSLGCLVDKECYADLDEYISDLIREWDYLNMDVLSNMKTGPFETDGTDLMRDMIYKVLKGYCLMEENSGDKIAKNKDGMINFAHFCNTMDAVKEKGGLFYQKLANEIKDFT
jgi:hypothetical protein